jgi:hypothetical protein
MRFGVVSVDDVNGYAITLGKRVGNDFEMLSVHFYVFGGSEAEVLDPGTLRGAGVWTFGSWSGCAAWQREVDRVSHHETPGVVAANGFVSSSR